MKKFEHAANVQCEEWEKWFSSMPEIEQYSWLLDKLPLADFLEISGRDDLTLRERIQVGKRAYYNAAW